ncbi:MAG TPA: DinB family protein [Terriglobia bacterium]|nr:DinB family protein [Terriglobia bacterium]
MKTTRSSENTRLLLQMLDEAYQRPTWHGPNLAQSLRGVSARLAAWRPQPGRHNIWEVAVHAAYWKYAVRRRLRGEPRASFALPGSNWFRRPLPGKRGEKAWAEDRELLAQEHMRLRAAVAEYLKGAPTERALRMIFGVAFHDVYHAGQIRLLRRLKNSDK